MNPALPTITVDDREARVNYYALNEIRKLARGKVNIVRKKIDFGDYTFPTTGTETPYSVGVEVSTPADLVGKANDTRLSFQISNLIKTYDIAVLMIAGTLTTDPEGYVRVMSGPHNPKAMPFDRLQSLLFSAQQHGLILIHTGRYTDVGPAIMRMFNYYAKAPEEHKYFRPQPVIRTLLTPVGAPIEPHVQALMTWPTIGEDKARAAIEMYGSIATIACLTPTQLEAIPGWGRITAKRIHAFLNGQDNG